GFARAVAYSDDNGPEFFHLDENVRFGLHAGLAQKKREARLGCDGRLWPVAKFEGVIRLRIGMRHFGDLERCLASEGEEGTLPEVDIGGETVPGDKRLDAIVEGSDTSGKSARDRTERGREAVLVRLRGRKLEQQKQHGSERSGHHHAFLIGVWEREG